MSLLLPTDPLSWRLLELLVSEPVRKPRSAVMGMEWVRLSALVARECGAGERGGKYRPNEYLALPDTPPANLMPESCDIGRPAHSLICDARRATGSSLTSVDLMRPNSSLLPRASSHPPRPMSEPRRVVKVPWREVWEVKFGCPAAPRLAVVETASCTAVECRGLEFESCMSTRAGSTSEDELPDSNSVLCDW